MENNSNFEKSVFTSELDNIIKALVKLKPQLDIIKTWEKLDLDFSSPDTKKNREVIKSFLSDKVGFYAIFDADKCLYIGIGRPIWKRIYSHYKAANGFEKQQRWADFFQSYRKNLSVYCLEFTISETKRLDDKIRMLIESLLEQEYKPIFEFKV